MDSSFIINVLLNVGASVVAALVANWVYDHLISQPRQRIQVKVGGSTIEIGSGDKEKINEAIAKIVELQKHPQVFIAYNHTEIPFLRRSSVSRLTKV